MTRYNVLGNSNDGTLRSRATTPGDAQEGSGGDQTFDPPEFTDQLIAGQNRNGTKTDVAQYFQEFTFTPVASSQMVTSACYKFQGLFHTPSGDPWSAEIREATGWAGGTLTTGNFVAGSDLGNLTLIAEFPEIRTIQPRPPVYRAGTADLRARLSGSSPLRIVASSNKQRLFFVPGNNPDEFIGVASFESNGGPTRPRLEFCTATKSAISRAIAAEVQLTDGTVAYLEFETDTLYLRHRTVAGAVTTITGGGVGGALPVGGDLYQFALADGLGAFSLTRDASNNLYVFGPSGAISNGIVGAAWVKGSGYSWSSKFGLPHLLPSYDQPVNQVTACWHQTGSGAGYLAVVAAHTQGYSQSNQAVFCTVSASTLLNNTQILGPGSLVTSQTDIATQYPGAPINASGTGLDICAMSGGRGVIGGATFDNGEQDASENRGDLSVYAYTVATNGQIAVAPTRQFRANTQGQTKQTGDMRAKLMRVSDTRFAMYVGGTLSAFTYSSSGVVTNTGSNPWLMNSGGVGGLTAFPQVLDGSAGDYSSDAIYDQSTGKVWVYYPDQANPRRIMRTGFNVNTGLLDLTEVQVATNTGASGSTNVRLRLPRGPVDERVIQVHLGNKAADGTLSLVHVNDTGLNTAPNAPVLNPVSVFSAGSAKQVTWVYSDSNPGDSQSAFQLQIRDQSSGTSVLDTGKVVSTSTSYTIPASTLSNNEVYEWRVRTYDQGDALGAYSAYSAFSTVSTGVVNIVNPATDNPSGLASPNLTITWTYTASGNLTQSRYRVDVIRTDTGALLSDSGFISGPDVRTYAITGLISDVEQQIELRVEDNTSILSNTATRLVTPIFSGPDQPTISTTPTADGSGILVSVMNPDPTGDLPAAQQNDIYRSVSGENEFIKIGETTPNGLYVDYGVASGESYDYRARAVADGHTDSDTVEGVTTTFEGVYMHDPVDAVATIRHFWYGEANKSDSTEARSTKFWFVGRASPVYEFGTQLDESVSVTLVLDDSSLTTWRGDMTYLRELARSKRVQCYRDNRGRKVFGILGPVSLSDEVRGTTATFTINKSDFSEEFTG